MKWLTVTPSVIQYEVPYTSVIQHNMKRAKILGNPDASKRKGKDE